MAAPRPAEDASGASYAGSSAGVSSADSFLRAAAAIHVGAAAPAQAGDFIARRFRLTRAVGRGAHGEVWEAEDRVGGGRVAVKLLRGAAAQATARVRREVAALRVLRVPGVVRLIDEGADGGRVFIAMDHVAGAPFPGLPAPCSPADLAGPLAALLEVLGRVHARGVIHRDLKPANVLVGEGARVTILDFGLSRSGSAAVEGITLAGQVLGTPAYLAPEQVSGDPITARADLYAAGVMAYAALAGRFPHEGERAADLIQARLTQRPAPIRALVPGVPGPMAALIDALLEMDPEDRPASAVEALDRIRPRAARRASIARAAPLAEEDLRALFAGPDRLFHLREDAARALWARTAGIPERVEEEIAAWVRAGLARRDADLLVMDRDAIERLDDEGTIAAPLDAGPEEIARAALRRSGQLARGGRLGPAIVPLSDALRALRRAEPPPIHEAASLLAFWVEIAWREGTTQALDRVHYELSRPGPAAPLAAHLEALVLAALAVNTWTDRALDLALAVPPFADPGVDRVRADVCVMAAWRVSLDREEAEIASAAAALSAAPDPETRALITQWRGRLAYCRGRFEEAAALHAQAAAQHTWITSVIAARLHGASALMEAFRFGDAAAWAAEAHALARRCRHAIFEARAEWILRSVAFREGRAGGAPDRELCDAASLLAAPHVEGLILLNEAAVAFRGGDRRAALDLAIAAHRRWADTGHPLGPLIARALSIACGAETSAAEVAALAARAAACPVAGVGPQVIALLAEAGHAPAIDAEALLALAALVPRSAWDHRMEVLSIRESLARAAPDQIVEQSA